MDKKLTKCVLDPLAVYIRMSISFMSFVASILVLIMVFKLDILSLCFECHKKRIQKRRRRKKKSSMQGFFNLSAAANFTIIPDLSLFGNNILTGRLSQGKTPKSRDQRRSELVSALSKKKSLLKKKKNKTKSKSGKSAQESNNASKLEISGITVKDAGKKGGKKADEEDERPNSQIVLPELPKSTWEVSKRQIASLTATPLGRDNRKRFKEITTAMEQNSFGKVDEEAEGAEKGGRKGKEGGLQKIGEEAKNDPKEQPEAQNDKNHNNKVDGVGRGDQAPKFKAFEHGSENTNVAVVTEIEKGPKPENKVNPQKGNKSDKKHKNAKKLPREAIHSPDKQYGIMIKSPKSFVANGKNNPSFGSIANSQHSQKTIKKNPQVTPPAPEPQVHVLEVKGSKGPLISFGPDKDYQETQDRVKALPRTLSIEKKAIESKNRQKKSEKEKKPGKGGDEDRSRSVTPEGQKGVPNVRFDSLKPPKKSKNSNKRKHKDQKKKDEKKKDDNKKDEKRHKDHKKKHKKRESKSKLHDERSRSKTPERRQSRKTDKELENGLVKPPKDSNRRKDHKEKHRSRQKIPKNEDPGKKHKKDHKHKKEGKGSKSELRAGSRHKKDRKDDRGRGKHRKEGKEPRHHSQNKKKDKKDKKDKKRRESRSRTPGEEKRRKSDHKHKNRRNSRPKTPENGLVGLV